MANPVSVERFHQETMKFYEHTPRIPYSNTGGSNYVETDCRGVILGAVRNAGYKGFRFSGTNDFWNNFCKWRGTPAEAKKLGYWRPGLILFNLDESTGKTTHMGTLTDRRKTLYPKIEGRATGDIINSSESKNGMILSDSDASGGWWNRCALALDSVIDYSAWFGGDTGNEPGPGVEPPTTEPETPSPTPPALGPDQAMVVTNDKKGLNLREAPDPKAKGIKTMPDETIVTVYRFQTGADGRTWVYVRWDVKRGLWHEGWCCADYLLFGGQD